MWLNNLNLPEFEFLEARWRLDRCKKFVQIGIFSVIIFQHADGGVGISGYFSEMYHGKLFFFDNILIQPKDRKTTVRTDFVCIVWGNLESLCNPRSSSNDEYFVYCSYKYLLQNRDGSETVGIFCATLSIGDWSCLKI